MDSSEWSHHAGAIFSARVWNRTVTAEEAARLYDMHASRLTPLSDAAYYWVAGRNQPQWASASSPSNTTLPVAALAIADGVATSSRAQITIRGQFLPEGEYHLQLRNYKNQTLRLRTIAAATARRRPAELLVFDLQGSMWPSAYTSAVFSIVAPDGLPLWQRLCLQRACGLETNNALRKQSLNRGRQGSRVTFTFTTDSRVSRVLSPGGAGPFEKQAGMLPARAFLGAASSAMMRIDGEDYLAVANFWDGTSHQVNSSLLKLRQASSGAYFEMHQGIPSSGARQLAHVNLSSVPGLAFSSAIVLANYLAPSLLMLAGGE